jgi:hypothetical protein
MLSRRERRSTETSRRRNSLSNDTAAPAASQPRAAAVKQRPELPRLPTAPRESPKETDMTRTLRSALPIIAAAALACAAASSASASGVLGPLTTSLLGGNCGSTQAVFAPWGDPDQYYFTNNGGFESGSTGWTLSGGAQVVAGNESFAVHSASDSHSLLIPAGGSATSPADCFGLTTPGIRFFAMSDSGPATIHVRVIASGLLGILSILDGGTATVGPTWQPTPVFSTTFSQLGIPVGTKSIQIQITSSANVQIDDIYIDPFCSR